MWGKGDIFIVGRRGRGNHYCGKRGELLFWVERKREIFNCGIKEKGGGWVIMKRKEKRYF